MKFSTILLILLFALSAFSQDYEVSVTEVMVWVKATDRSGKAITNLTQSDFELFEDDQKMTPTCFEEVTFSAALVEPSPQTVQSQPAETMPATAKRVVLILDLYNTQQAEYLYVRPKITEFLKQLPANWEVALATMIPGTIEINIPFTNKMKDIETKLDQITANSKRDIEVLNRRRSILNLLDRGAFPKIIEEAYRLAGGYATEEKDMARQSLQALQRFKKDLDRMSNQSHLVALYISGGINSEPGRQYFDLIERRVGSNHSLSSMREGGSDLWGMLRKTVAELNTRNITLYTINTRGNISSLPDSAAEGNREIRIDDSFYLKETQDLMAEMADETGGLYFENSSNFRHGFDLILGDLDHQYLICYKAPAHKKQNEFHKIKVTTKKSGVKLRHRKTYFD